MQFRDIEQYNIIGIVILIILCVLTLFSVIIFKFPLWLAFVPIIFFIGLIISIIYTVLSIQNKKIHLFCFYILFMTLSLIIGIKIELINEEKTKTRMFEIINIIENYYEENGIVELDYDALNKIEIKEKIFLKIIDENGYTIEYRGIIYNGKTKEIRYRPRP